MNESRGPEDGGMTSQEDFRNPGTTAPEGGGIDSMQLEQYVRGLRDNQNIALGVIGGAVGAGTGAAIWAGVTYATNYQIGWMAIGVGFLAGYGVKLLGRGIDPIFGMAGGVLALLGCAGGNLLTGCIYLGDEEGFGFANAVVAVITNPAFAVELMKSMFHPMDVLFYSIAVYQGYRVAFHTVSDEDLEGLTGAPGV